MEEKTASEIVIEEEKKIKDEVFRQKELKEMDSRELLYRYTAISGYREVLVYRSVFEDIVKDLDRLEKEKWFYESELLKRLDKKPNNYNPRIKI